MSMLMVAVSEVSQLSILHRTCYKKCINWLRRKWNIWLISSAVSRKVCGVCVCVCVCVWRVCVCVWCGVWMWCVCVCVWCVLCVCVCVCCVVCVCVSVCVCVYLCVCVCICLWFCVCVCVCVFVCVCLCVCVFVCLCVCVFVCVCVCVCGVSSRLKTNSVEQILSWGSNGISDIQRKSPPTMKPECPMLSL